MKHSFLIVLLSLTSLFAYTDRSLAEEVAVEVSGALVTPGTYRVAPNQRIIDVIKMAGGGELPPLELVDCRAVSVVDSEGRMEQVDLLRYINTGDLAHNPYVEGGQSIRIGFATERVYISGDIQGGLVGDVPVRSGETARELLELYTLNPTADTTTVLFERVGDPPRELSLAELGDVALQNLDGITVFPHMERTEVHRVELGGEVLRPGVYAITHGETTARELLARGGGAASLGDTSRAWVLRREKIKSLPKESLLAGMENLRREVTYSMSNAMHSGDYAIIPLREYGHVPLEDGDLLYIPRREKKVYLSGSVKRPGAYPYTDGKSVDHYVELAGGFRQNADPNGVYVVETYGDHHRILTEDALRAGTMVVVPEFDREGRTRFVLEIVRTSATILTSLITVGTFVYNVSN
ncbi:SLBB domain-containing protein [Chitinivibrio alkaliphilus]|uniref:Soluble ligand binding domain-containing protein n=1 Tax=Chitinivibrio alkaliphilus ACht1 TaxID=1313304 RepID=U7D4G7_9BACT|nr:SLBB domain-containing protein [Chitinivibrio alkaliphilus]ERP31394.1 hypothetical protein CALK_1744 [Chitinivibrio alkaliphilus ACht1]